MIHGKHPLLSYYHHLIWGDILVVKVDDQLDASKVRIVFENEMAMKESNDSSQYKWIRGRFRYPLIRKVVYERGKQVSAIPYDYRKQRLLVYYDDKRIGCLGHWQTNGYHSHRNTVFLSMFSDNIWLEGDIKGPDDRSEVVYRY